MTVIYNAQRFGKIDKDFDNVKDAKAAIEAIGEGQVIKFIHGTDGKDRSCALEVYTDGRWRAVDISR